MNLIGELALLSNMVKSINESIGKLGVYNIEKKLRMRKWTATRQGYIYVTPNGCN